MSSNVRKSRRTKREKISIYDDMLDGTTGTVLSQSRNIHEIIGEVEVIYRSKRGNKALFTRTLHKNDLLINGAVYLSEKVNNMRSTFLTTPIDAELGVHAIEDIDRSSATVPLEKIVGIMVGNGGCGDTYNTVHKVHRTDRTVPGMLPFRVVPINADLDDDARARYILRVVKGDYVYYYGKKFTTEPEINVLYDDGTVVPTNVDVIGDSDGKYIKTFTKFTATIDQTDIREYFKITQGSTMRSLINSLGLITGYTGEGGDSSDRPGGTMEAFNVRTMTTLNMENAELKDSESVIVVIYRLYFA